MGLPSTFAASSNLKLVNILILPEINQFENTTIKPRVENPNTEAAIFQIRLVCKKQEIQCMQRLAKIQQSLPGYPPLPWQ